MGSKNIKIDDETDELLHKCKDDYLNHHPELKKIRLSYNKLLYEIAKFYLKH